jgi:AAA+ ATPase superfamily predicted ATPase
MKKEMNPFVVTGKIEPDCFCDRVKELEKLIRSVTNGNNMVVISPRRMGKTGLIQFCYDKSIIKEHYYPFFIDILHTTSLREFTYQLGKTIFETLLPRSHKMALLFVQTLKSINGRFGFNPMTNMPTFSVELGDIERPEFTLEEVFSLLSTADKPCLVAIDEFQQVAKYPEKNIEALLRGHIQKMQNCQFIFAGSERSMLQAMFLSAARPFYLSADVMELNAIEKGVYVSFVKRHFKQRGRFLSEGVVERVYDRFKGHTFYVQKTFNEAFADTPMGGMCTDETISMALVNMLAVYDTLFQETLSRVPEQQKALLYAIAKEGEARQLLSADFIKRHRLKSASAVQAALRKLLEMDLITEANKMYEVTDKLFAMWINRAYG